jgi:hypothetical protein
MKPPDDEIKDSFKAVKMTLNTICSNDLLKKKGSQGTQDHQDHLVFHPIQEPQDTQDIQDIQGSQDQQDQQDHLVFHLILEQRVLPGTQDTQDTEDTHLIRESGEGADKLANAGGFDFGGSGLGLGGLGSMGPIGFKILACIILGISVWWFIPILPGFILPFAIGFVLGVATLQFLGLGFI